MVVEVILPVAGATVLISMTFLFLFCFRKKNKDAVEPLTEDDYLENSRNDGPITIHPVHVLQIDPGGLPDNAVTSSIMSYASSSLEDPPPSWSAYRPKAGVAWAPTRSQSFRETPPSRLSSIHNSFVSLLGSMTSLTRSSVTRLSSGRVTSKTKVKSLTSRSRSESWSGSNNRVSPHSIAEAHRIHSASHLCRQTSQTSVSQSCRPASQTSLSMQASLTQFAPDRTEVMLSPVSITCRPKSETAVPSVQTQPCPRPRPHSTTHQSENLELSIESLIQAYQQSPRKIRPKSHECLKDKTNIGEDEGLGITDCVSSPSSCQPWTSTPDPLKVNFEDITDRASSSSGHSSMDTPINEEAAEILNDLFNDDPPWVEFDTPPLTPSSDNPPGVLLPYKCALDLESIQSGSVSDLSEIGHSEPQFRRWHSHHGYPNYNHRKCSPIQVSPGQISSEESPSMTIETSQHSPTAVKPSTPQARRSFRRSRHRASLSKESLMAVAEQELSIPTGTDDVRSSVLHEKVTELTDLQSFLDSTDLSSVMIDRADLRTGRLLYKASNYSICSGIIRKSCIEYPSFTRSVAIQIHKGLNAEQDRISCLKNVMALRNLRHRNILEVLGVCVEGSQVTRDGVEFLVPTARVHFHVTLDRLISWAKDNNSELLTPRCAMKFALQICRACNYLEKMKIYHSNLMASTVMLDSKCVIKLSGIEAHQITSRPRNHRWLPLETLNDTIFNAKSVVWSYGVVLWELASMGQYPYPHLSTTEEVHLYLANGKRLICPEKCPKPLYRIIYECWHEKGRDRPTFEQLFAQLSRYKLSLPPSKPPEKLFPDRDDFMEDEYI